MTGMFVLNPFAPDRTQSKQRLRIYKNAFWGDSVGVVLKCFVLAIVLYVGWLILSPYPRYLPPDFTHGFLRNKAAFFFTSGYFVGFYSHIFFAPLGLVLGAVQLFHYPRRRWPQLHRAFGKAYVFAVLLGVAPGGLVMAMASYGGVSSAMCFGLLSLVMWWCTWQAYRAAVARKFRDHADWMLRSYVLMCSAILLRLISFVLSKWHLGHTFSYQLAAWLSWLPPLVLVVAWQRMATSKGDEWGD